jgi:hypothetical protein
MSPSFDTSARTGVVRLLRVLRLNLDRLLDRLRADQLLKCPGLRIESLSMTSLRFAKKFGDDDPER